MKYAVMLDGGFVVKKLQRSRHLPSADEILERVDAIRAHPLLSGGQLLRTYFYHAMPAKDELRHPMTGETTNLAETAIYRENESLIQSLEVKPHVAVRLGDCVTQGWKVGNKAMKAMVQAKRPLEERDLVPNIGQKGVDLRIALDIARLSLREMVDVLVVVTGDSDFVPAFKFARREGLMIYLDSMNHGVKRDLKVHVDAVLDLPSIANAPLSSRQ